MATKKTAAEKTADIYANEKDVLRISKIAEKSGEALKKSTVSARGLYTVPNKPEKGTPVLIGLIILIGLYKAGKKAVPDKIEPGVYIDGFEEDLAPNSPFYPVYKKLIAPVEAKKGGEYKNGANVSRLIKNRVIGGYIKGFAFESKTAARNIFLDIIALKK